jgi:uncharacterized membrane protein
MTHRVNHDGDEDVLGRLVERNISALTNRRREAARQMSRQEHLADAITSFTGSMPFVYIHLAVFGSWILWNLEPLGLPRFDPSFVVLAMIASVEAIFLSTFVLISQNRSKIEADERAELDLQISLLSEHEVTRLVTLVAAIARRLDVEEAYDPEIPTLEQDVRPEEVMDELRVREQQL